MDHFYHENLADDSVEKYYFKSETNDEPVTTDSD